MSLSGDTDRLEHFLAELFRIESQVRASDGFELHELILELESQIGARAQSRPLDGH